MRLAPDPGGKHSNVGCMQGMCVPDARLAPDPGRKHSNVGCTQGMCVLTYLSRVVLMVSFLRTPGCRLSLPTVPIGLFSVMSLCVFPGHLLSMGLGSPLAEAEAQIVMHF